jgi:hypothetical protein
MILLSGGHSAPKQATIAGATVQASHVATEDFTPLVGYIRKVIFKIALNPAQ